MLKKTLDSISLEHRRSIEDDSIGVSDIIEEATLRLGDASATACLVEEKKGI